MFSISIQFIFNHHKRTGSKHSKRRKIHIFITYSFGKSDIFYNIFSIQTCKNLCSDISFFHKCVQRISKNFNFRMSRILIFKFMILSNIFNTTTGDIGLIIDQSLIKNLQEFRMTNIICVNKHNKFAHSLSFSYISCKRNSFIDRIMNNFNSFIFSSIFINNKSCLGISPIINHNQFKLSKTLYQNALDSMAKKSFLGIIHRHYDTYFRHMDLVDNLMLFNLNVHLISTIIRIFLKQQ